MLNEVIMKVLITGVNGFIGKNIAKKCFENGMEVIGVDVSKSDCTLYKTVLVDLLACNIKELLVEYSPDVIVHCAGLANVSYSIENPTEDFNLNTLLVHKLLFAMKENNMQFCKFILLSSAAVYGQPIELPIDEKFDLKPLSPYALHKKMSEDICQYFIDVYKFNIKILRIFSAYGPGLRKQIFWDMYWKLKNTGKLLLYGTGKESRDYIYIDDLVNAIYLIMKDEESRYIVWNIGNGEEVRIEDVAKIFIRAENKDMSLIEYNNQVREGDPLYWCADISQLKALGYHKTINISEGINRYVDWIENENEK